MDTLDVVARAPHGALYNPRYRYLYFICCSNNCSFMRVFPNSTISNHSSDKSRSAPRGLQFLHSIGIFHLFLVFGLTMAAPVFGKRWYAKTTSERAEARATFRTAVATARAGKDEAIRQVFWSFGHFVFRCRLVV